jgi:hypothetical protein
VWRAAGLDPARSQSGAKDARLGISREGSAWGRRALLDLAAAVCRQPGRWRDGFRARTTQGRKPAKVALVATGNSIGRTCFALMRSGADYDPAFRCGSAVSCPPRSTHTSPLASLAIGQALRVFQTASPVSPTGR